MSRRRVNAADAAAGKVEPLDPAAKAVLAAERIDSAAEVADEHRQAVAPQVRAMFVADLGLAAALDKPLEHPIDVGTAHAAGELAVAEGSGAPFSEQIIVFAIELAATVEFADRGDAFFDRPAALQNQGPVSAEGEIICRQEAGRARTDHNRPLGEPLAAGR